MLKKGGDKFFKKKQIRENLF